MTTQLLLIRHGETPWNVLGKIQGLRNIDLSEVGRNQAELLNNRLQGAFHAIYSSPLNRAYETAQILCKENNLHPTPIDDLIEIDFGTWEGLTSKEIKENYLEHYTTWREDPVIGPMYDGEGSIKNASIRARNCLLNIVKNHPNETIVVVSHGGFIKASLIGLFNWPMTMYHQLIFGNTCLTTIRFDDNLKPILMGLNDTNHLI